ncbi:MAG: GNAT family N-acetyltransferase [Abitibacteriaceae bacterium]|nr:GNAT family N-acetyltransferase [Abditibacteriaceae bacterium]
MTDTPYLDVVTERLELIAGTLELANAEASNLSELGKLLRAYIPETWPPGFNDADTVAFCVKQLSRGEDQVGWWHWYVILPNHPELGRVLIGLGGFKGQPMPEGDVEVGYAILEDFQRCGYGTEAVQGLIDCAFSHDEVRYVMAETLPELKASQGLLHKLGFHYVGAGSEAGSIRFELARPAL